jgi:D-xylose transport system substrate-binding protein
VRRKIVALAAAGMLTLGGLAACSDDAGDAQAAPQRGGNGTGKIGVILPDLTTSQRWGSDDPKQLAAEFKKAGVQAEIENAKGSADTFKAIGDRMIAEGATVLILVSVDPVSGKYVIDKARAAGVKTIDYDRLTLNGNADYYVSFDNVAVGRLQGQGLLDCIRANPENAALKKAPRVVYLNGAPTDNNATLFKEGYDSVLGPKFDDGTLLKGPDQSIDKWDPEIGKAVFVEMYTQYQYQGDIQGVLAANDSIGAAVIEALTERKRQKDVAVTGQDAEVGALQKILTGEQCMTVYKSFKKEAKEAAKLAIQLHKGEKVDVEGRTKDIESGGYVPSVLIKPMRVGKKDVATVIKDGGATKKAVCTGRFEQACAEVGIE